MAGEETRTAVVVMHSIDKKHEKHPQIQVDPSQVGVWTKKGYKKGEHPNPKK